MSWSVGFPKPVAKAEADAALDAMILPSNSATNPPTPPDPTMLDQLRTAKLAARVLITNVPGPYLNVSLNGHANGIGWQGKEGWSNDCINVSVTQITEEDMKRYYSK